MGAIFSPISLFFLFSASSHICYIECTFLISLFWNCLLLFCLFLFRPDILLKTLLVTLLWNVRGAEMLWQCVSHTKTHKRKHQALFSGK